MAKAAVQACPPGINLVGAFVLRCVGSVLEGGSCGLARGNMVELDYRGRSEEGAGVSKWDRWGQDSEREWRSGG